MRTLRLLAALLPLCAALASTISKPLLAEGDINNILPDYYTHKATKAYHNSTPSRTVAVPAIELGRSGGTSCSVKFRLRWAAEVESAVYSTPVVFPSGPEGKNEIYINTFYQYIELLGYDGYKPFGWPISFEEASFHGSPMLYDIDGDGKNDVGMVDTNANMYWVRIGEFGQYLEEFHVQVPKLKVRKNWAQGMSSEFVDSYVALSMFDREADSSSTGTAPKAKLDVLSVKPAPQASYPGLSSVSRRLSSGHRTSRRLLAEENGEAQQQQQQPDVGKLDEGLLQFDQGDHEADSQGENGPEETFEDDYMRRYRENPNPFGDGAGAYYHFANEGTPLDQGSNSEIMDEYQNFYSAHRHRHYMDDLFVHSYYSGMDMYNDTNFAFVDPHVLSSPVLTDVNGDGDMEVILTISYYFDAEKYRGVDLGFDPTDFIAGGVGSWNLELQSWNWLVHLDLTTDRSRFKALIHSTPTVADLDGDGRAEVVFGTSLGLLYVLDGMSGFVRTYFPMQFHEIQSQVAVADVVGDLDLEIIFGDMGGNVVCLSAAGNVLWDAKVSGVVTQTPTIGDVDGDGDLDVVITATFYSHDSMYHSPNGEEDRGDRKKQRAQRGCHVWAFDGATGEVLPMFPMALPEGSIAIAPVVLVDLHDYSEDAEREKSSEKLIDKDIADLVKLAEQDAEVMTEAKKQQLLFDSIKIDDTSGAAKGTARSSAKTRKKRTRMFSVSDPAVPPWIQTTAGHEPPPAPSLQATALVLQGSGGKHANIRGSKNKNSGEPEEEVIIASIEKVLSKDKGAAQDSKAPPTSNSSDLNSKSMFKDLSERQRRQKEAELLKHIRYHSDSGSLGLHLLVAAGDGHIYIIDGATGCAERIDIGEHVYSMPLVDDLSQDGFLDLIVGTVNGQVLALETEIPYHPLNTWSSFPKHRGNGFTHGVSGVSVPSHERRMLRFADTFNRHEGGAVSSDEGAEVETGLGGNFLPVTFDIWDARGALYDPKIERYYDVTFSVGMNRRQLLAKRRFSSPGRYTMLVPVQPPDSFLLVIGMTNEHGQYFEESVTVSLCAQFYVWIKYIVSVPLLIFATSLLIMKR